MLVKLDNVKYTYNRKTVMEKSAVSDISLEIGKGEFVSILGKTGSGKSTVLSLLSGTITPQSGNVEVACPFCMMYQNPESQLFAQTVFEDVMYGPENIGMGEEESKQAALDALKLVEVEESLYSSDPSKLSGGQKRKVALAGILSLNRPLVLIDEPTAGLDNRSSVEIMNALKSLNESGITIVVATHDCDIAVKYSTRIIAMNDGRIVFDGKPHEFVYRADKLNAYGIDIPGIYLISSILNKNGLIHDKNLITAKDIFQALKINKK